VELEIFKLDSGYVVKEKGYCVKQSAHESLEDALTKILHSLDYHKGKEGCRVAILSRHETACQVRPKPED